MLHSVNIIIFIHSLIKLLNCCCQKTLEFVTGAAVLIRAVLIRAGERVASQARIPGKESGREMWKDAGRMWH